MLLAMSDPHSPTPPPKHRKLTAQQQAFVEEYLVDLNATQAGIRAGYSKKSARMNVTARMAVPGVAAAIEEALAARSARTQVAADRVVMELARVGFSDLRRVFAPDGSLRDLTSLDDDTAAAIASVKVVTRRRPEAGKFAEVEYVTEGKFWDKNAALEKLGRHMGMFRETIDMEGLGDLGSMIETRRQRAVER